MRSDAPADDPDARCPVVDAPRDRRRREGGALEALVGADRRRRSNASSRRARNPAAEEDQRNDVGSGRLSRACPRPRRRSRFSRCVPEREVLVDRAAGEPLVPLRHERDGEPLACAISLAACLVRTLPSACSTSFAVPDVQLPLARAPLPSIPPSGRRSLRARGRSRRRPAPPASPGGCGSPRCSRRTASRSPVASAAPSRSVSRKR